MVNKYHILPVDDTKEHCEEGVICECRPEIRKKFNGYGDEIAWVVIHNSWDGREWEEMARGIQQIPSF